MNKPQKCQGCKFYGSGKGFVPATLTNDSPIFLMGEFPSSDDVRGVEYEGYMDNGKAKIHHTRPQPFLGYRGHRLKQLGYEHVNKDFMIRCQPPVYHGHAWDKKRNVAMLEDYKQAAVHCGRAHLNIPESTKLIVAHGDLAWDGLLNQIGKSKTKTVYSDSTEFVPDETTSDDYLPLHEWRGFLSPVSKFTKLPIYGVHDLKKNSFDKIERYVSEYDWAKIPKILDGSWPEPEPTEVLNVTKTTTVSQINAFYERYLTESKTPLVIDTEYTVKDKFLRLFGCGYHTRDGREHYLQLYWSNSQNPDAPRKAVVDWMFRLQREEHQGFLFQNAAADNPVLHYNWRTYGKWGWPSNFHDTMLLHAKLESELPHGLEFLESIYSRRAKKKHLSKINELLYHLGDLSTTLDCWNALKPQLTPGMWDVYHTQDLLVMPKVQWSHENGIRVNHNLVEPLYDKLKSYMAHAVEMAQAYCGLGKHFNLNSDAQCKDWIYGREQFPTIKDRKTRAVTINTDALLKLRQAYAKLENVWEVTETDEMWNPERLEQRIFEGGCHPLLESKAAFNYYEDKIAKYIRTQLFDDQDRKLLRVYPHISIHAQATGRHSTTKPPLAQWPDEMQNLLTPDPGWMWLGGDYAGQEVWLYSCQIHDERTLDALMKGYDTHTMAMCDFWGWDYPVDMIDPYKADCNHDWRTKYGLKDSKNPYRIWTKAGAFALRYLKGHDKLHLIPGSRGLDVDSERGLEMCERFFQLNPSIKAYRESVIGTRPTTAITFTGRTRRLHMQGTALVREWINSPIQGGGADILNHTIIRATSVDPDYIHYVYGVHDSFKFTIPLDREEELTTKVMDAILQPYTINGYTVTLPVEWKKTYCSLEN